MYGVIVYNTGQKRNSTPPCLAAILGLSEVLIEPPEPPDTTATSRRIKERAQFQLMHRGNNMRNMENRKIHDLPELGK